MVPFTGDVEAGSRFSTWQDCGMVRIRRGIGADVPGVLDRTLAGHAIGTMLLDHARELARADGVELLRVDCFAGGDGALVRYYEKQGFTRAEQFVVPVNDSEWPGQVLIQRL
jgi:GNAT superfamily N-acetyltransferase